MTKEERFFELVQAAAAQQGAKFFTANGEGREIVTDQLEGEDLFGWLIPLDRADAFFADLQKDEEKTREAWSDFCVFAIWNREGDGVKITFKRF